MNYDTITLRAMQVAEAMTEQAHEDFKRLAEHLRRSIGQRYRRTHVGRES